MKAVIVGGGEVANVCIEKDDYIIAVDSGYKYLKDKKIDIAIGDFDSLGYVPQGVKVLEFDERKDYTDMQLAMQYAFDNGYKSMTIYGGMGGRLDHSFANIQLGYAYTLKGCDVTFICSNQYISYIKGKKVLQEKNDKYISIFAIDNLENVSIEGMEYNVKSINIDNKYPLGVSNQMKESQAIISIEKGIALLVVADKSIVCNNMY